MIESCEDRTPVREGRESYAKDAKGHPNFERSSLVRYEQ
jgi:hypothetical protein